MTQENPQGKKPLRIAVVHSFYSSCQSSGENRVVEQQVHALGRAGYSVRLFAERTDERQENKLYPLLAAGTVATGRGPSPLAPIVEFKPDVVYAHNLFPNYGRTWVRRWTGPLVAVMHNYRAMCARGTLYRDGDVCTQCLDRRFSWPAVKHACYRESRLATIPLAAGMRFGNDPVLSRANRIVVLNSTMQALYHEAGVEESRLVRVPNFLSHPAPAGSGGGPWLFVGRLTEEKGILRLVHEWPEDIPLLVIGSGPDRAELEKCAPPSVILLGEQPAHRVSELMRSARGLVFPSRWFEGSPMVYLEALAAGTPVLAWEPSSVASLVREEGTGLVAGVTGDLAESLGRAEASFPTMRARCRQVYEARYTEQAWLGSISAVFDAVTPSSDSIADEASHRLSRSSRNLTWRSHT